MDFNNANTLLSDFPTSDVVLVTKYSRMEKRKRNLKFLLDTHVTWYPERNEVIVYLSMDVFIAK
jgi:hypothetical protein